MNEIPNILIKRWKEKTKSKGHIVDYINFWSYIDDLIDNNKRHIKEIGRLNNIINEYEEKIQMIDSVCRSLEFSAPENDYIFKERLREIIDKLKEIKEKEND